MENLKSQLRPYGWLGLLIMISAQVLLIANVSMVKTWFTPIMWSGYILFADALLLKLQGRSLIHDGFPQFLFMLPYSVACWLIFEAYNLHLQNWQYIGLPEKLLSRYSGYVWSFATIFPGILLTYELVHFSRMFAGIKVRSFTFSKPALYTLMLVGLLCLVVPILVPQRIAAFLFGPVWIGFVLLLDPVNYLIGAKSLFKDLEQGRLDRLFSLFAAGAICGIAWEFWNYWATAKWVYNLPFLSEPKIFEMPLFGFLGFLPFAVEVYVMWAFAVRIMKFGSSSIASQK